MSANKIGSPQKTLAAIVSLMRGLPERELFQLRRSEIPTEMRRVFKICATDELKRRSAS